MSITKIVLTNHFKYVALLLSLFCFLTVPASASSDQMVFDFYVSWEKTAPYPALLSYIVPSSDGHLWRIGTPYADEALQHRLSAFAGPDSQVVFHRTRYSRETLEHYLPMVKSLVNSVKPEGFLAFCNISSESDVIYIKYWGDVKDAAAFSFITTEYDDLVMLYDIAAMSPNEGETLEKIYEKREKAIEALNSQLQQRQQSPAYLWAVYRRDILLAVLVFGSAAVAACVLRKLNKQQKTEP